MTEKCIPANSPVAIGALMYSHHMLVWGNLWKRPLRQSGTNLGKFLRFLLKKIGDIPFFQWLWLLAGPDFS